MSSIHNNYLFKCDLLYKRNKKSYYDFPKCKNFSLQLSLLESYKELNMFSNFAFSDLDNQNNMFIFLYINYFLQPFVILKKNEKNQNSHYILKLKFLKNNVYNFLYKYMYDLYLGLFDHLLIKNINKFSRKSVLLFFRGNFLQNSDFRLYTKDVLSIIDLKKLSFSISLTF